MRTRKTFLVGTVLLILGGIAVVATAHLVERTREVTVYVDPFVCTEAAVAMVCDAHATEESLGGGVCNPPFGPPTPKTYCSQTMECSGGCCGELEADPSIQIKYRVTYALDDEEIVFAQCLYNGEFVTVEDRKCKYTKTGEFMDICWE